MRTEAPKQSTDPDQSDPPPRALGRTLSAKQFWDLMERWHVPDAVALDLIEYPGKLGASGKRPRFRFTTRQQRITSYLPEIDAALAAAGKDPNWLHRRIGPAPFSRHTPIEHMRAHGMDGMLDLIKALNREAMRRSLQS